MSKHLPIVLLAMLMIITLWGAEAPVGAWKVNPARSTWTGDPRLKSLIVRFQGHPHGEVFTQERIEADGRTATVRARSSTSTVSPAISKALDAWEASCRGGLTVRAWRSCASVGEGIGPDSSGIGACRQRN